MEVRVQVTFVDPAPPEQSSGTPAGEEDTLDLGRMVIEAVTLEDVMVVVCDGVDCPDCQGVPDMRCGGQSLQRMRLRDKIHLDVCEKSLFFIYKNNNILR